jgi:hypothetical protein
VSDLAALDAVPCSWLYLARESWRSISYLVVRHRVRRIVAARKLAESCRYGAIRVSHWCPHHDLPPHGTMKARNLEARAYGQPLWCGCYVTREKYGYGPWSDW